VTISPDSSPRRPRRRPWRVALLILAGGGALLVAGAAVFVASFDPDSLKPRIAEAVRRATGRELTLNGPITLKPSLWPTVEVRDASFSNPPGFSRPQMASLERLRLQLALLPLLSSRFEIERLILIHPDILLETDAAGHPNWQMTPPPPAEPSTPAPESANKATATRTSISVDTVRIQDGRLAYRDGETGKVTTLGLPRLDATAASPDAALHVDADASYDATAFNLVADTGSLTRLQDPAAATPWPVKLGLTAAGATLAAEGALTQPLQGRGYSLAVNGTVPDLAALAPLLPGVVPPPLHDLTFATKVADQGGSMPVVSALTLHVGASDLGAQVPGLRLDKLDVTAPAADQPLRIEAAGRRGDLPVSLAATLGPPALLMPGAKPGSFPIDATLQAAGATVTAKGSIADARALTGAAIVLAAQIPDLSALSKLADTPLPALKPVAFKATLTDVAGGLRNGVALHGLNLTTPDGDLAGDLTLGLGPRRLLTAVLTSNRIDLDALQAATAQARPAAPTGSAQAGPAQAGAAQAGPAPTPPPQPGAKPPVLPPAAAHDRLFSDQPIPFDRLRSADADLRLTVGTLRTGGADDKAIATHAVLKGGKLAVDPLTADLPQGHMDARLSADASMPTPPVHVWVHAPGLALTAILAALRQPSIANGNLEVYADLGGAGATPHAIAASLDGFLGLALGGGTVDNRLLGSALGRVMEQLNALNLVARGGASELRCFALRMDAQHGVGTIRALALSSALLTLTGAGSVNLGQETLDLTLRPQLRLAGNNVVLPLKVSGPIRAPGVAADQRGAAEANVGAVAGALAQGTKPRDILGGLLADQVTGGGADICPPALAMARGKPAPAEPTPASRTTPTVPDPGVTLRNLFR